MDPKMDSEIRKSCSNEKTSTSRGFVVMPGKGQIKIATSMTMIVW